MDEKNGGCRGTEGFADSWAAVAKCQAESSGSGASAGTAGTAAQPAEKAPASSAADMTDMDNPEYLGQLAATFVAPGG